MIKSDRWIKRMALEKAMIVPFEERQVRQGAISYGVSSYGYDIRIADAFNFEADEVCAVSYADRQGKDQAQQGIVLPKV